MPLIKGGQFVEDPFFFVPDGKAYPDEKGVIVTLARFQGERDKHDTDQYGRGKQFLSWHDTAYHQ